MRKVLNLILCLFFLQAENILSKEISNPPMGWNSFNSYGVYLYEEAAIKNIDKMSQLLKPYGYTYFVIDAGWFSEYEKIPGTHYAKVTKRHSDVLNINEYGILQPSKSNFPNGIKKIADYAHSKGLKFGLHLMRGIPKEAVKRNTPIKGTKYFAKDIADTINTCKWCPQNYGIDMNKPGAQEFYNSVINQLAEWGVDFIKYDDIVPYPLEVEAVCKAIKQCKKNIILSLSPGDTVDDRYLNIFEGADMVRITHDIWDDQKGIDSSFKAWKEWQNKKYNGFWADFDMIPFGQLQLMSPKELSEGKNYLYSGKGHCRKSLLSKDQMYTFITIRAMAASPLFVGGDLITIDKFSLSLLTNKEMIKCNQNGKMGKLINTFENGDIEIWKTESKNNNSGWIAIFNRNKEQIHKIKIDASIMKLKSNGFFYYNIWEEKNIDENAIVKINPNGVVFLKYNAKHSE